MEQQKNNVLVIGNGFDLAHSLKTSYRDFIDDVRYHLDNEETSREQDEEYFDHIKNNSFIKYFLSYTETIDGWVDVEHEIKRIIQCINNLIDGKDISYFPKDDNEIVINDKLTKRVLYCFGILSNKYAESYRISHLEETYYHQIYGLKKKKIIVEMEEELKKFIRCFELYLEKVVDNNSNLLQPIEQISNINPTYVVSYNYTDTYKLYGINRQNVFHIHGKIGEGNIVLGIEDEEETNLDFIGFKKYFQRIQNLTGYFDETKFILGEDSFSNFFYKDVYFYGHSLDKTDDESIRWICNHSEKMIIFFLDEDDYKQKVVNLIAIFGKQEATEMIQRGKICFEKINNNL